MSSKSFYEYPNVSKTYLICFRTFYMHACIADYDIGLTSLTTPQHLLRLRCIFIYMCYNFHHPYFYTTDAHRTILYTRTYIYISTYMIRILHPHDVYASSTTPPTHTYIPVYVHTDNKRGGVGYICSRILYYISVLVSHIMFSMPIYAYRITIYNSSYIVTSVYTHTSSYTHTIYRYPVCMCQHIRHSN